MSHPLSARCVRGGRVLVLFLVGCGLVAALAAGPAAAVMNNQQYGFLNQIGGPGAGVGQFGGGSNPGPYGVAVDAVGNVFAVDPNTSGDHVQKFASNGSFVCSFGSFGQNEGELAVPYGIAVGADGTVYVLDTYRANQNRIQKYVSADGGLTYSSAGQVSISPLDGDAYFMAVDAGGNMYVAEKNGGVGNDVNRILKYAPGGGAVVATIGSTGSGVGQIDGANGVAVSSDGSDVYVANGGGGNVKRFHSANGTDYVEAQLFSGADAGVPLGYPLGLCVDAAGNVFVVDNIVDRVVKFAADGDVVTSWGSTGPGDYQTRYGWGVAVNATGCVCVSDPGSGGGPDNHRVMRYARDLTPPTSVVSGAPSGWTNAARVALTFSGTDPVVADEFSSGYQVTQLLIGAIWSAYSGDYPISREGVTTVQYRATDRRNNVETDQSLEVRIDRTKPTIAAHGIRVGWSKTPASVTFDADDALSGVARTEYSTNGGSTWTAAASVTIPARGATMLSYRAVDNAGNVADTQNAAVLADGVKPVPRPLADVTVRRGKSARLRYRVTDAACPQVKVTIKIRKGGKTRKTLPLAAQATGRDLSYSWKCTLAKGAYTWTVYATDLAGNAQAKIVTRKLIVR